MHTGDNAWLPCVFGGHTSLSARVPSEPHLHRRLESVLNQDLSGSKDRVLNTTRTPVPVDSYQGDLHFLKNFPRKHQFPSWSLHPRTRVTGGSQEAPCSSGGDPVGGPLPPQQSPPILVLAGPPPGRPRASSALTPSSFRGQPHPTPTHPAFQSLQKLPAWGRGWGGGGSCTPQDGVGKPCPSSRGFLPYLQLKTTTANVASTTRCGRHLRNGVGDSFGGNGRR